MLGIITRRRILYWIARLLNRSEELLHLLPPVVTTRLRERRLVKAIRGTTTTAETPPRLRKKAGSGSGDTSELPHGSGDRYEDPASNVDSGAELQKLQTRSSTLNSTTPARSNQARRSAEQPWSPR